jgi:hypothetical protein
MFTVACSTPSRARVEATVAIVATSAICPRPTAPRNRAVTRTLPSERTAAPTFAP